MLSSFCLGEIILEYWQDEKSGMMGLIFYPANKQADVLPSRGLSPGRQIDPLAHFKIAGKPCADGFSQGVTLRGAGHPPVKLESQTDTLRGGDRCITTQLAYAGGLRLTHDVIHRGNEPFFRVHTQINNTGETPVALELLTSFSFGSLSPFAEDRSAGRLHLHRVRSWWSGEGKHDVCSLEALHLTPSRSLHSVQCERFGQIGSMPVRGWFPFVAIEDREAGVFWGAQLAWSGSWQMEVFRRDLGLALSGGLADREFGHWLKALAPGEMLSAPEAILSTGTGHFDAFCQRLTSASESSLADQPAIEHELPIVCNEWCTTWGNPTHENVLALADKLQGSPAKFLVIDAGWYRRPGTQWHTAHGDWETSPDFFPDGIEATARAVRERGLIPGLWFELETVGHEAKAAVTMDDHFLKRDGSTITSGHRRFWNLRDPEVLAYLTERVINTLRRGDFGYLKIDYNETIGIGCDGEDSLGEGLRLHVEAIHTFFRRIREALPGLVIENCSSGGHRLEPAMLALTAQSSFSDAHESIDIPVIAASLHRLVLPRQSQIWAVLHPGDSPARLSYSLAATFLGRMALSGNLMELDADQWAFCLAAQNLYTRVAPIIRDGTSILHGVDREDHRNPRGSQAVVRISAEGNHALVVVHAFPEDAPAFVDTPLPDGFWSMNAVLTDPGSSFSLPSVGTLRFACQGRSTGGVAFLERKVASC